MMEAMASGTVDEFVKHPGKSFGSAVLPPE